MSWYRASTISLTNGSTAVTGAATDFIANCAVGEGLLAPDGKVYEIAAIVSATALTLGSVYLGSTASGQSYAIIPSQSYLRDLALQAATLVNDYQSVLDSAGAGKFGDGTLGSPGIQFSSDSNTGLRRTGTDAVALVTGGVDRITVDAAGAVAVVASLSVAGSAVPTLTSASTLTNKTLTAPVLANPSYSGATANGGTVTTIDINGGTIDGTVIGGTTPAAVSATTLSATSYSLAPFTVASGSLASFPAAQGLYNYYSGGGVIGAYSNNAGTLATLSLDGSSVAIRPNGSTVGAFSTTGLAVTGELSSTGAATTGKLTVQRTGVPAQYVEIVAGASGAFNQIKSPGSQTGGWQVRNKADTVSILEMSDDGSMALSAAGLAVTGNITSTTGASLFGNEQYITFSSVVGVGNNDRARVRAVGSNAGSGYGGSFQIDARNGSNVWGTVADFSSTGLAVTGALSTTEKLTLTGIAATVKEASLVSGTTTNAAYHRLTNTGADCVLGIAGSVGSEILSSGSPYATQLYTVGATPLQFGTNSAVKATLDTSGNLGLGVVPSAWFSGVKAIEIGDRYASLSSGSGWSSSANLYLSTNAVQSATGGVDRYIASSQLATRYQQQAGTHTWSTAPSGTAGNAITFTQAMTLDAGGNLLVGTTATNAALEQGVTAVINSGGSKIHIGHVSGVVNGESYSVFSYAGSAIGTITQSGTTAVAYNTTSDARLKENITDASDAASLIDALQVRQFDWKSDGSHQRYGFVAQELYEVAPEAVSKPQDPDEMMAVDYSKLVPMLVKEIQSLRQRVAQLEGI